MPLRADEMILLTYPSSRIKRKLIDPSQPSFCQPPCWPPCFSSLLLSIHGNRKRAPSKMLFTIFLIAVGVILLTWALPHCSCSTLTLYFVYLHQLPHKASLVSQFVKFEQFLPASFVSSSSGFLNWNMIDSTQAMWLGRWTNISVRAFFCCFYFDFAAAEIEYATQVILVVALLLSLRLTVFLQAPLLVYHALKYHLFCFSCFDVFIW